ncbi:MAG: hypothetical protein KatS3mg105_1771 [Gemmatales bacterium]|nr:MAG: hypothetical protein KatS3mg105_1771 [Gemmatales bacterium]
MKRRIVLVLAGWLVTGQLPVCAGHKGCGRISIGIGIGVPAYRPYWGPCRPYWYRPVPVYVAPPPVIVQPVPVVERVIQVQPVEEYQAPPRPTPKYEAPPPRPLSSLTSTAEPKAEIDHHLDMLSHQDERVRAESVMQLGRLRAYRAVDAVAATLAGDRSPSVRESAARALGLIGSKNALPALERAAQIDPDRDVRRAAQFSIEVIQSRQ